MSQQLNWINHEWKSAHAGGLLKKVNPWNGLEIELADSDVMDVVVALQTCKKNLTEMEKLSGVEILQKIKHGYQNCHKLFLNWAKLESSDQGLPEDFFIQQVYQAWLQRIQNLHLPATTSMTVSHPTGVVAISVPWALCFHEVMDRLVPALLARNTVLIHLPEEAPQTAQLIVDFIQSTGLPSGCVQILQGKRKNLNLILAGHPGISALSWSGPDQDKAAIVSAAAPTGKKIQIHTSVKNSLILLPGRTESLSELLQSSFQGMGQLPWNTTRIFILESEKEKFLQELTAYLQKHKSSFHPLIDLQKWTALKEIQFRIPGEEGKVFYPADASENLPLFSIDLPNCSTWQQEDLRLPYFIVTAVKYSHEIAKWTNTGSFGHSAVIYGDEEKACNLAAKLEVGLVQINQWNIPSLWDYTPLKSSSYGMTDLKSSGNFFSNISSLAVKTSK